jgi:predicted house-cleaning noncanonical NTP pyrophosphatase (MazG superfamily)
MTVYNKLVRDKIPEIIEHNGGKAEIRLLSDEEYTACLEKKLDEEVGEYHRDKTPEELADILEVVYALAATSGCSREQLMAIYQQKHDNRGGFEKRYYLISSE